MPVCAVPRLTSFSLLTPNISYEIYPDEPPCLSSCAGSLNMCYALHKLKSFMPQALAFGAPSLWFPFPEICVALSHLLPVSVLMPPSLRVPPEALLYHSIPFTSTNHTSRSNLALYFIHLAIGLHVEESRNLLAFVAPSTPSLSVNRVWLSGGWEHLCTSLGHQAGSQEVSPSGNASDATHGLQTPTLAYQPLSPMCSGPGEAVGGRGS